MPSEAVSQDIHSNPVQEVQAGCLVFQIVREESFGPGAEIIQAGLQLRMPERTVARLVPSAVS